MSNISDVEKIEEEERTLEDLPLTKSKREKKPRTEKQMESLKKAQQKRKEIDAVKKEEKIINASKLLLEKEGILTPLSKQGRTRVKTSPPPDESSSSDEENIIILKKKPKKKKRNVVIMDDSSSSSSDDDTPKIEHKKSLIKVHSKVEQSKPVGKINYFFCE